MKNDTLITEFDSCKFNYEGENKYPGSVFKFLIKNDTLVPIYTKYGELKPELHFDLDYYFLRSRI